MSKELNLEKEIVKSAESLILEIPGILKEFIRAGISNPVIGVAGSLIMANMLYRAGVIDEATFIGIAVAVGVSTGANAASEIIGSFIPFHQNASSTDPSASTVVFGDSGGKELSGLIESIKGKVKS